MNVISKKLKIIENSVFSPNLIMEASKDNSDKSMKALYFEEGERIDTEKKQSSKLIKALEKMSSLSVDESKLIKVIDENFANPNDIFNCALHFNTKWLNHDDEYFAWFLNLSENVKSFEKILSYYC